MYEKSLTDQSARLFLMIMVGCGCLSGGLDDHLEGGRNFRMDLDRNGKFTQMFDRFDKHNFFAVDIKILGFKVGRLINTRNQP